MLKLALVVEESPVDDAVSVSPLPYALPPQPEKDAEPPDAARGLALHPFSEPLLIVSVTGAADELTILPKESSKVTTGCVAKEVGSVALVVADADPVGWVEKTSWLAGPGPVTPKAALVTGLVGTELEAEAVSVYGVAR
jgi:hypothetical protein